MIKATIESLQTLLTEAGKNGCTHVKLQLYDNWDEIIRLQRQPPAPVEDYQIDLRFYNTVEFDTEVIDQQATDKLVSEIEGDTLIIHVSLSDMETLLNTMGISDAYDH